MNNTLMIINILSVTYYTFTGIVFIFILLGIIGKFGLFPLNLGIFGIVDNECMAMKFSSGSLSLLASITLS